MRYFRTCLLAALMVGLAACSDEETDKNGNLSKAAKQDAKIKQPATSAEAKCPNFYTRLPDNTPDLTRKVYTCVERYALVYAKGPDSADALSKAVMVKCKDAITQYVDQEAKKAGVAPPYEEAFESWQGHTLPIIAEARARGCYG